MMKPELRRALAGYFERQDPEGIVAAYLFGSRARGHAARESDVDVGVLLDPLRHRDSMDRLNFRVRLIGELIQALGENEVDVVILNDVPPTLGAKVIQDGIRVYAADLERVRTFERDTQLRAADLGPFLRRKRQAQMERLRR